MFFLTEVDQARLDIRGSRDPLGFVPLWGDIGRKVVGNLTTASDTYRGFTTLLLGLYFAEQVSPGGRDREKDRLAAFLRFEQLAGYVRWHINVDGDFRGITAVKKRLGPTAAASVRISADSNGQILSNQRTYGIWGLYMLPGRSSGLVADGESALTTEAREFVEATYITVLSGRNAGIFNRIKEIAAKSASDIAPAGKDRRLFAELGALLAPKPRSKAERQFYHDHLVDGGPGAANITPWQREFARLVTDLIPNREKVSIDGIARVASAIKPSPPFGDLRLHLERIIDLERFLVPAANLFGFLQTRHGKSVKSVAAEIKTLWKSGLTFVAASRLEELRPYIARAFPNADASERLLRCAAELRTGDYQGAVEDLIAHNGYVMSTRDGVQPWIRIDDGKLVVRYAGETERALLEPSDLKGAWRNTYYIDPLKAVIDQLRTT